MAYANESREFAGKLIIRTIGAIVLAVCLVANPLVLRPRTWTTAGLARSAAVDTTLIAMGVGLMLLRRWAAILMASVAGYLAVGFGGSVALFMALLFLILLASTVLFWRTMQWGRWSLDPLLILAGALISAIMYGTAGLLRAG